MKSTNSFVTMVCGIVLALMIVPTNGLAHDKSMHKGKPTEGVVTKVGESSFQVKTDKGPVTVELNEKTKYEMGDSVVKQGNVMKGMNVRVFGTKLPGSKVVAKEVLLETQVDMHKGHQGGMERHKGQHDGHKEGDVP